MKSDNFLIITFHNKSTSQLPTSYCSLSKPSSRRQTENAHRNSEKKKTTDTSWKLPAGDYFHPN